jgi:hypothetical protein
MGNHSWRAIFGPHEMLDCIRAGCLLEYPIVDQAGDDVVVKQLRDAA